MHHIKWFCYTRWKGVFGLKQRRSWISIITALMLSVAFATGCARRATVDDEDENNPLFTENSVIPESNVETVSVSEPFYNSRKILLEAPIPYEAVKGEYESSYYEDPLIVGDHILVRANYYFTDSDDAENYYEFSFWHVFDLQGNYLMYLHTEDLPSHVVFDEDASGNIVAACADYHYEDEEWFADISVVRFDSNGYLIAAPTYVFSDKYSDCLSMAVNDENGDFIVASKHKIVQIGQEGDLKSNFAFENGPDSCYVWEENGNFYMQELQTDNNGMDCAVIYQIEIGMNGYINMGSVARDATNLLSMKMYQTNTGVYASTRNALGKLDFASGEFASLLDWNQTDLDRSTVFYGNIKVLSEGSSSQPVMVMEAIGSDYPLPDVTDAPRSDYSDVDPDKQTSIAITAMELVDNEMKPSLYLLSPADENPHEGQDILWVGGIGITSSGLMTCIARFNEDNSQNVWIKVYDYAGFNYDKYTVDDLQTKNALEKMAAQVNSGMGPDIIIGAGETGMFDNSRSLTDLNAYVDGISGINRKDYFDNVLSAFETDGKLYQIPLAFSVYGLIGNRSLVGDRTEMTLADFADADAQVADGVDLFGAITAEELCNMMVEGETNSWINYSNDTVSIDRNALVDMVITVNNKLIHDAEDYGLVSSNFWFPQTYTIDPRSRSENRLSNTEIYMQNAAFEPSSLNNVREYAQKAILPEILSWYGYPGSTGSSFIVRSDMSVGISASSTQKEKAWEVIKYFLSEDIQIDLSRSGYTDFYGAANYIPLNKEAFRSLNDEMQEFLDVYITAMDEEYNWVEFYAGKKDVLIDEYEELMNAPMRRYIRDPKVIEIVKLNIGHYYYGEYSLDETVDMIIKEITAYIER